MRALLNAPWYHSAPNSYALGIAQENGTLFVEERFDAERTLQLIERTSDHPRLPGADDYVRMLALPAAVRARTTLVDAFRLVDRQPVPARCEARDDRLVGSGDQRVYGASELGYMTLLTASRRCASRARQGCRCRASRRRSSTTTAANSRRGLRG